MTRLIHAFALRSLAALSVGAIAWAHHLFWHVWPNTSRVSETLSRGARVVAASGGTLSIAIGSEPSTDIAIAAGATVQDVVDAFNAAGLADYLASHQPNRSDEADWAPLSTRGVEIGAERPSDAQRQVVGRLGLADVANPG